jgi:hypothetical protein
LVVQRNLIEKRKLPRLPAPNQWWQLPNAKTRPEPATIRLPARYFWFAAIFVFGDIVGLNHNLCFVRYRQNCWTVFNFDIG